MNNQENIPSAPYYFHSLTLQNVRCFGEKPQTIEFTGEDENWSNWNIILGENGVGKTTTLLSLGILNDIIPPNFMTGNPYIKHIFFSNPKDHKFIINLQSQDSKKIFSIKKLNNFNNNSIPSDLKETKVFGYGASRRIGQSYLSNGKEPTIASNEFLTASLFDEQYSLRNAEEWLLQVELSGYKKGGDFKAKKKVEKLILQLLEDNIHEIKSVEYLGGFGIELKTDYGWAKLKDLNLGYKTLIAWVVDFASRLFEMHPESDNPFEQPAIVLVDEIDLHMHPKMQQKLIRFLTKTFPNTQFIATAHSPLIVQSAPDANIILLKKVGDHVEVENNPQNIKNWRIDQILTSDLFGLESARSPEIEKLIKERIELNAKVDLSENEQKRLEEINETIGYLPTAEQSEDIEAMRIIRAAAAHLKGESDS